MESTSILALFLLKVWEGKFSFSPDWGSVFSLVTVSPVLSWLVCAEVASWEEMLQVGITEVWSVGSVGVQVVPGLSAVESSMPGQAGVLDAVQAAVLSSGAS